MSNIIAILNVIGFTLIIGVLIYTIVVIIKNYKIVTKLDSNSMFECDHLNSIRYKVELTYLYNDQHLTITRKLCTRCIKNYLPIVDSMDIINLKDNKD